MSLVRRLVGRVRGGAPSGPRWRPFVPQTPGAPGVRRCVICAWEGEEAFGGGRHAEFSICPSCGAIGRDRWLFHCLTTCVPGIGKQTRLLETSPRMGDAYKDAMSARVEYLASDYDQRAHKADIALDLQKIALPDAYLDVVMTSHVLEHVPDTDAALAELYRVLKPGGSLLLLVPVLQGLTAPPKEPEFHGDDTPVFWRFGVDLTGRLRSHGFDARLLCIEDFKAHVERRDTAWPEEGISVEWDIDSLVGEADPDDLTPVCSDELMDTLGLRPSYMYLAWHGKKPA